ncbi:hypothetical protein RUESEDTHA_00849 [Ruegeria sp. THAF57]|uniref:helix-turn-helix domain-containing protein n=1 Tax=Ruegeria sp. THAF57 TaxID=2744555 RepID=UPI0015DE53F5|nr:helix-turn-helix domain-containing protein [Ruegeria sp. THAF57]CAD0183972.1 hypothetical protein RUESEDTHA_00849 [Ruegeria sp. THAF57]
MDKLPLLKDERHEKAVMLFFCDVPAKEIAKKLGVSLATVYRWLSLPEVKQTHADLVRAQMQGALPELVQSAVEQARNPRTGLMAKVKLIDVLMNGSGVAEPPPDQGYRPSISINLNTDGERDPSGMVYIDSSTTHIPDWGSEESELERLRRENEQLKQRMPDPEPPEAA